MVLAGGFILFYFPPEISRFYPPCPIWSVFHIRCPGCGGMRALAALLHGDLRGAMRLNALVVCALPGSAGLIGLRWMRTWRGCDGPGEAVRRERVSSQRLWRERVPRVGVYVGFAAMAVFTVARNF